jgi:hypothetical protein
LLLAQTDQFVINELYANALSTTILKY